MTYFSPKYAMVALRRSTCWRRWAWALQHGAAAVAGVPAAARALGWAAALAEWFLYFHVKVA
jgi:hypothetical protein